MARALRVQYPGAVYHVTLRGNARQNLCEDARDREQFQGRLAEAVDLYRVRLHAYCLMTNHAHLVLETPGVNLSRFMQSLSGGYATYFNLRHKRVGHLSQGRFGARLAEVGEYLHRLSRYVHLNPVCTKAAKQLPREQWVDRLRRYRKQDVAWRRPVKRVSAEVILEQVGKEFGLSREALGRRSRDATVRSAAARMLVQQGGLTQREAGAQLGLGTGAAVSIQLRRLAERLCGDQKLRHHLDRIEAALAQ